MHHSVSAPTPPNAEWKLLSTKELSEAQKEAMSKPVCHQCFYFLFLPICILYVLCILLSLSIPLSDSLCPCLLLSEAQREAMSKPVGHHHIVLCALSPVYVIFVTVGTLVQSTHVSRSRTGCAIYYDCLVRGFELDVQLKRGTGLIYC